MTNYQALFDWLPDSPIAAMGTTLPALIREQFDATRW